jgi:hypothetical protein
MALQTIPGEGLWLPKRPPFSTFSFQSSTIDATGEKFAWIGRFWHKDRTSKDIRNAAFLFGTVTKAGGSALTLSLQDVAAAATPPQPDETQDQTVAIANADAGFVSNAWYETGNLSADRTVAYGALLAVVLEYDGSGRLSTDTVSVRNPTATFYGGAVPNIPCVALKTASWAAVNGVPNIALKCSDGTYGTLMGAYPISSIGGAHQFKQDTAGADEYGIQFSVPFPIKVDAIWALASATNAAADADFVFYNGTTEYTVSQDGNHYTALSEERLLVLPLGEVVSVPANTTVRVTLRPNQTANNVRFGYIDVGAANIFQAHDLGTDCIQIARLDLGSDATTSTRRPLIGVIASAFDDGAGGGGGSGIPGNLLGGILQ